jgi:hypothetical protein
VGKNPPDHDGVFDGGDDAQLAAQANTSTANVWRIRSCHDFRDPGGGETSARGVVWSCHSTREQAKTFDLTRSLAHQALGGG